MKETLTKILNGAEVRSVMLERFATNTTMVSTGGLRRYHKKENAKFKGYLQKVFSGSGKPRQVKRAASGK